VFSSTPHDSDFTSSASIQKTSPKELQTLKPSGNKGTNLVAVAAAEDGFRSSNEDASAIHNEGRLLEDGGGRLREYP